MKQKINKLIASTLIIFILIGNVFVTAFATKNVTVTKRAGVNYSQTRLWGTLEATYTYNVVGYVLVHINSTKFSNWNYTSHFNEQRNALREDYSSTTGKVTIKTSTEGRVTTTGVWETHRTSTTFMFN